MASGCDKNEKKKTTAPVKNYKDSEVLLHEVKNVIGENVKNAYLGRFEDSKKDYVVAGSEINTKDQWGIKFFLLEIANNTLEKKYETDLLKGSFEGSFVNKIKFPSLGYELVYYNSGDYFLGSGGGEVFSYVVDFNLRKVYYSHLIIESKEIALYLSKNIDDKDLRNFFISNFKKDYPSLTIVSEDIIIYD